MNEKFSPDETAPAKRFLLTPVGIIVVCAALLSAIGLITVFSATKDSGLGSYYYISKQLFGLGAACLSGLIMAVIPFDSIRRHALPITIVTLILLVAVYLPVVGVNVKGSNRWVRIPGTSFSIQASEIGKIVFIFILAHYLALNKTRLASFKYGFIIPLGIIALFALPIAFERDLGTAALLCAVGAIMLFLAGLNVRYIIGTLSLVVVPFILSICFIPNVRFRFLSYLDVESNKADGTYQLYRSLAAFAYGGETGVGLGQGRQQLGYIPEVHTDFIFAVLGEELGLVATLFVTALFLVIFICGIIHLRRAPNLFQYLVAAGTLLFLTLQAIINLGVVTGLFPTKGMSLPFMSAGISNLACMGALIGIFINTQRTWSRPDLGNEAYSMREIVD